MAAVFYKARFAQLDPMSVYRAEEFRAALNKSLQVLSRPPVPEPPVPHGDSDSTRVSLEYTPHFFVYPRPLTGFFRENQKNRIFF